MRLLTLAAGLATGYVLGTRAGRERYEQIAAAARKAAGSPAATQAQSTAKALINAGMDKADTRPRAAGVEPADQPVAGTKPSTLRETETPSGPVTYTGTPLP
ncbi:hypothetical protein [Actinoplanes sp. DH11]|uniref:hypothetical protein n=1 Tax=Actinoplanes sp. DH11 TaxID=2857011 RepID=UPI001E316CE8|nr:hypothetical protein [Actinoplanes sp. DH11]